MINSTKGKAFDPNQTASQELVTNQSLPRPLPAFGGLLLILFSYIVSSILLGIGSTLYITNKNPGVSNSQIQDQIAQLMLTPSGISWSFLLQLIVFVPIIYFLANFKEQTWIKTLGFNPVKLKVILFWLGISCSLLLISGFIDELIELPTDDFTLALSGSKHFGLAITMVIFAPFIEEVIFRGYLFQAWRSTCIGASGTIVLTSILFALIHGGQYGAYILFSIFIGSVLMGIAREKTGSIYVPMALHSFNNLLSVVFVVYLGFS